MAESYLQLLDQGGRFGLQVLQQIDNNMTRVLQTNQAAQQAKVQVRMKGLQFAEETRMNDARIADINNQNIIRSKQFELDQQLAPLKLQTEQLRLEATKYQVLGQKRQQDVELFNSMTAPYDKSQGSLFMQTQSPEHMRAYLDYKGQEISKVATGQPFNPSQFKAGLDEINSQYQAAPQTKAYSPEISQMLGMIDPNAQKRYEQENPTVTKNVNALAVSYVMGTDATVGEINTKFGELFTPEKLGQVAVNRQIYQTNQSALDNISTQMNKLSSAVTIVKDEGQRAEIQNQLKLLTGEYSKRSSENQNIIRNLTTGNFGAINEAPSIVPQAPEVRPDPKQYLNTKQTVLGVVGSEGSDTFKQRINDVASIFTDEAAYQANPGNPLEATELRNVNMSWFENTMNGEPPNADSLNRIKLRVEDGVNETGIEGKFNPDRIGKLFKTLNTGISVPVSPWLAGEISKNLSTSEAISILGTGFDTTGDGNYKILFDQSGDISTKGVGAKVKRMVGGDSGIASFETMQKIIQSIPGKAAKEEAKKELYSALTAAALGSAVSR